MKKEMLINVLQEEECRIAIVEDGVLEELYVERSSQESYVGNIYKGRIVNIEPSIQAAFVDFGIGRNGFLHVSDVDPAYYKHLMSKADLAAYEEEQEREFGGGGRDRGGRDRGGPPPRPQPRQPDSWLPPQPQPKAPARPPADDEDDGFGAGLDDQAAELPLADEAAEDEVTVGEAMPFFEDEQDAVEAEAPPARQPVRPPAPPAEDDEFAAGIDDGPPPSAEIRNPKPETRTEPKPASPPPPPAEDDEFGAGLDDIEVNVRVTQLPVAPPPAAEEPAEPPAPPVMERAELPDLPEPAAEPEAEVVEKPKPKARVRKKKVEEAPEPAPEPTAEEKPKPKRRTKKKADDGDDDGPKVMGGAERRTAADDEPEIRPFFEGGDDFDPDAPNDRFPDGVPQPREEATADVGDDADTPDDDGPSFAAEEGDEEPAPAGPAGAVGRGFNDDFDDARAARERNDRDRGGRGGRDRDRGGRGGRDRDRGGRGGPAGGYGGRDRDRGPDRGPPRGGRNGGGGGPPGRERGFPKPLIQDIFKRGQEVIVQVIKEGIGTKGPALSTYVSIAGRYLVLMPSLGRVGVSRKIEDHEARRRLRDIMATLTPPKGVGFIVRTAAVDRDARELRNDLAYLLRLWQVMVRRIKRVQGPAEIYKESDMITRTIRDVFTSDVDAIWVDEPNAFAQASEFLQVVMPRFADRIKHFDGTEPLFHKYGVEEEIAKINQKRLDLPGGGSIIIEPTEALVAIDVNSGTFRAENNAEETAYQMNLRAAKEIARQLRLRDLGGVIVNDFIDMRSETHRRNVENALRDAVRRDRARTKILRVSQFGIIEMTRQRIRPSLKRSIFADCPHCRGTGHVKTNESLSIEVMRLLQLAAHRTPAVAAVQVTVHPDVAHYLLNRKRKEVAALEARAGMEVVITAQPGGSPDHFAIRCQDGNGSEVRLIPPPPPPRLAGGRQPRVLPERDRRNVPNLD